MADAAVGYAEPVELRAADPAGSGDVAAAGACVIAPAEVSSPVVARLGRALPFQLVAIATWLVDLAAIMLAALACDAWRLPLWGIVPIAIACHSGIAQATGGYDTDALLLVRRALPRVLNAWVATVLALATLGHAFDAQIALPWRGLVLWFATGLIAIVAGRILVLQAARRLKHAGLFQGRTAVVGTGRQGVAFADHLKRSDGLAMPLLGFFDDRPVAANVATGLPLPYLGGVADLVRMIRAGTIDRVFLTLPWADETRIDAIVRALSATPVDILLLPDRGPLVPAGRSATAQARLRFLTVGERPLTPGQRFQKALMDRTLALVALILCAPLMLAVAVAIRLDSGGPVLFRQLREGLNCRPFHILKFRTMYVQAGAAPIVQAGRRDPRVTRVGGFLRRTSLDELPQLINVLIGQMSLVGPRPHAPATRAGGVPFGEVVATYADRHKVKPGLTGWAQVCGWRGETTTTDQLIRRLEHDMHYVNNWSIWFDIYILARTALTVLGQRSAY
ncbi:undecaprenyl-phosphate glucose phosphotransferase [Sphingomonas prati]|uniref:Undecaprenyl-phosphate glucose phosphotransferase n=1 Tax=Sphingomonas prati TaxID=1843237 RepID=A0A7W9BT91_9SPHN|nr:undecaprenyl-phosphate glucose phosphotransferase [Sphingomonas prati]MBB5729690.1 Undecaprenyl-phosphate glucose phosphotransferase [Sphingomonas prati]GGE90213.1 hypothetical protein GCM10011404_23930 [Sphingomonas prati]